MIEQSEKISHARKILDYEDVKSASETARQGIKAAIGLDIANQKDLEKLRQLIEQDADYITREIVIKSEKKFLKRVWMRFIFMLARM